MRGSGNPNREVEATLLPCLPREDMSLPKPTPNPTGMSAECARLDALIADTQAHLVELLQKAAQRRAADRGNRSIPQMLGSRTSEG